MLGYGVIYLLYLVILIHVDYRVNYFNDLFFVVPEVILEGAVIIYQIQNSK